MYNHEGVYKIFNSYTLTWCLAKPLNCHTIFAHDWQNTHVSWKSYLNKFKILEKK